MKKHTIEIGHKFNKLTIISHLGLLSVKDNGKRRSHYLCECDCGNQVNLMVDYIYKAKSCGCMMSYGMITHGESSPLTGKVTAEYKTWQKMKARCSNDTNRFYRNHGGRGIQVCERWLTSYPNFLEDMGRKPSSKHSIDRIDNSGNYEPSNCRWATTKEQASNTRRNVFLEINGEIKTVTQWAELKNMKPGILRKRLKLGWSHEDVVNKPLQERYRIYS